MVDVGPSKRNQPIVSLGMIPRDSDSDDAFASDNKTNKRKKKNKLKLNSSRNSLTLSDTVPKSVPEEPAFNKLKVKPTNSCALFEEIDLSLAEPDLLAHGISSQETIIMSSCESLTNSIIKNESLTIKRNIVPEPPNMIQDLPVQHLYDNELEPEVPDFDNETVNRVDVQKDISKRRKMDDSNITEAKRLKFDRDESLEEKSKIGIVTVPDKSTLLPQRSALEPEKVKSSSKGSSHMSPAPGLRLGLSRNRRTSKPLHPAIKSKDYQL